MAICFVFIFYVFIFDCLLLFNWVGLVNLRCVIIVGIIGVSMGVVGFLFFRERFRDIVVYEKF